MGLRHPTDRHQLVPRGLGGWVKKNPAAKKAWDELVPVGRMAETWQIKPLALLLASDAGSYMTGSHVMIDGGMQLGSVKPLNE